MSECNNPFNSRGALEDGDGFLGGGDDGEGFRGGGGGEREGLAGNLERDAVKRGGKCRGKNGVCERE